MKLMPTLQNQVAIVTGAASGIGKACAITLAEHSATVIVNHLPEKLEAANLVVEEIKDLGGEAIALAGDVSNEADMKTLFQATKEKFGTVHILINNAGIQRDSPFVEMPLEIWNKVINANLTGQFLCARSAAQEFLRRGMQPDISKALGKIICISSVHEAIPWARHANYAASKGGVEMLMKTIAQELAPHKIRVNGVAPGAIKTSINRPIWETESEQSKMLKLVPYGRLGEPNDVANTVVWLASDESDYVVGSSLVVDGGMMLYPGFRTGG